ncbi:MAG: hypothetical protein ACOVP1_14640 [Bacteroidia bacterium]
MKKLLPYLLFILFFTNEIQAQYKVSNWGFSLGTSIPTGRFGSMDITKDYSGWARYGANVNFFYSQQFANSNFGIIGLAQAEINPIASQDVANEYWIVFPYYNWTVEGGAYKRGGLMFGGFSKIKANQEISFIPRATLGLMAAYVPQITTSAIGNGEYIWLKQNSKTAFSPTINLGIGLDMRMTRESSFFINFDYQYGKPNFKDIETIDFKGIKNKFSIAQPMANLNINMGLAFEL